MKLLVVESPAKAKTISKYLGPEYIVRATMGHICDLSSDKDNRLGVDIANGFVPKYKVIPDKKDKIAAIVDTANQVDFIYLAADKDREGEAIAFHVANQLKKFAGKIPIKRITFDEITKSALIKAINSPRELDKDLYDAQQARRVLDRLVGFMVSPFVINLFGQKLSAGRVQSVCLKLIVEREKEIETFKPETYYNISANLAKSREEQSFLARYVPKTSGGKVTDGTTAAKIKEDLEKSSFKITNIEAKQQKRNPYPPLTTSKLQQAAAGLYKFAAAKTMKCAQTLYESGHITYLRTDSVRSSPESVEAVRSWIKSQGHDLPETPNTFKNKESAQDAHEAIRPTHPELTPSEFNYGSDDEIKLYKLIWERFVASQMKPAVYDTMTVFINASKGHELKANGRTLRYSGWLAITEDFDDKEEVSKLPKVDINDNLLLIAPGVKAEKKETQPPPRYTDGSLVNELEKRGIGRPSTYAAILTKISDRDYVEKEKTQYRPTVLGRKVADALSSYFSFMEYNYSKEMEDKLDLIEHGKLKYADMMQGFYDPFLGELKKAQTSQHKDTGHKCPKCNSGMVLKHSKFGYFIGCSNYPECKTAIGVEVDGDTITIREKHKVLDEVKCPKCASGMVKRDGPFGAYYSCSKYPKCDGRKKIPYGKNCPKCDSDLYQTIYKDKTVLFCMGYPKCTHQEPSPTQLPNPNKLIPKKLPHKVQKHINKKYKNT